MALLTLENSVGSLGGRQNKQSNATGLFTRKRPRSTATLGCKCRHNACSESESPSDKKGSSTVHSSNALHSRTSLSLVGIGLLSTVIPLQCSAADQHNGVFALADIDPQTAGLIASILGPALTLTILLFIFRIPMSWYPNINFGKFPWSLVVAPTEPFLGPTRKVIPPVGGVDIAPIIWVAVLSFVNEILLGPQGILNLLQRQLQL